MITKAIIQSVNYASNTCNIIIPIFETAGVKKNTEFEATMIVPPGVHSGYQTGDVVFISFYDNSLSLPVVLGKLYVNESTSKLEEAFEQKGFVGCNTLEVESKATLPIDTKLTGGTESTYKSIQEMAEKLKALEPLLKGDVLSKLIGLLT